MRSQLLAARAAALFASDLSVASRPGDAAVERAIAATVRARGGTRGCVAEMAAAYGDRPEIAAARMRWARDVVLRVYGARRPEPERAVALAA